MGIHPSGCCAGERGRYELTSSTVAWVVPDLPAFAMDDGFAYRVPEIIAGEISVGSVVRVPLAGRRIRGYVVGVERSAPDIDPRDLKDVRSVASPIPVFRESMLPTLRWAADHYVAPIAKILAKTGPPNLPKLLPPIELPGVPPVSGPVPEVSEKAAGGHPVGTVQILAGAGWSELIRGTITPPVSAGRSVLVIAPTAVEAGRLADRLVGDLGSRVLAVGEKDNAAVTAAWSRAATQSGVVVVGTLRTVWWPVKDLSMIVLVEEDRPGMKERQTPTVAAGALARMRSATEGPHVVLLGRVPGVHIVQDRTPLKRVPGRLWGSVEMVDRTDDPPGEGMFSRRVKVAITATLRREGRVFVFTHRRGYAPAARCVGCRKLRICPACGSRPDSRPFCPRCEAELGLCPECGGCRFEPLGAAVGRVTEELRRMVADGVGDVGSGRRVIVGTERDLVALEPVNLTVVVDADGLVRGTNYRATEEALALLARVAATVRRRAGGRTMVQTADPSHPVYTALRRGDPVPYLSDELMARRRFLLPPCGEVMVVEVEGVEDRTVLDRVLEGSTVFGPARAGDRIRWIVQGHDLRETKERLRATIGRLRDRGCKVRLDVDPREF